MTESDKKPSDCTGQWCEAMSEHFTKNPLCSLAFAALVGMVVGLLFRGCRCRCSGCKCNQST
jgi:ElaB/YqjD/DUF883 family membrane-anchored ribosome-binding protein